MHMISYLKMRHPIWMLVPVAAAGPATFAACEAACASGLAVCLAPGVFLPGAWLLCGALATDCFGLCTATIILPTP